MMVADIRSQRQHTSHEHVSNYFCLTFLMFFFSGSCIIHVVFFAACAIFLVFLSFKKVLTLS